VGHAKSAARFAQELGLPVASGYKERISDTRVVIRGLVGRQISGFRRVLIYDDEIATGSSVIELCNILLKSGVEEVYVVCTHGVFVHQALEKMTAIPQIKEIVTTDTVYIPPEKHHPKLKVLSVAPIFGEAIRRNYLRQSIGSLFVFWGEEEGKS
jgi:ribose-phosphate pyrophosphokinase